MADQDLEKLFGFKAIRAGFISQDQLFEGLRIQLNEILAGKQRRHIGAILESLNYIKASQVSQGLDAVESEMEQ